jgi:hypothetical protein
MSPANRTVCAYFSQKRLNRRLPALVVHCFQDGLSTYRLLPSQVYMHSNTCPQALTKLHKEATKTSQRFESSTTCGNIITANTQYRKRYKVLCVGVGRAKKRDPILPFKVGRFGKSMIKCKRRRTGKLLCFVFCLANSNTEHFKNEERGV